MRGKGCKECAWQTMRACKKKWTTGASIDYKGPRTRCSCSENGKSAGQGMCFLLLLWTGSTSKKELARCEAEENGSLDAMMLTLPLLHNSLTHPCPTHTQSRGASPAAHEKTAGGQLQQQQPHAKQQQQQQPGCLWGGDAATRAWQTGMYVGKGMRCLLCEMWGWIHGHRHVWL